MNITIKVNKAPLKKVIIYIVLLVFPGYVISQEGYDYAWKEAVTGREVTPTEHDVDSLVIPKSKLETQLDKLDSLYDTYTLEQRAVVTDSIDQLIEKAAKEVGRQIDSLQKILERPLNYPKRVLSKTDAKLSRITDRVDKLQHKITSNRHFRHDSTLG